MKISKKQMKDLGRGIHWLAVQSGRFDLAVSGEDPKVWATKKDRIFLLPDEWTPLQIGD